MSTEKKSSVSGTTRPGSVKTKSSSNVRPVTKDADKEMKEPSTAKPSTLSVGNTRPSTTTRTPRVSVTGMSNPAGGLKTPTPTSSSLRTPRSSVSAMPPPSIVTPRGSGIPTRSTGLGVPKATAPSIRTPRGSVSLPTKPKAATTRPRSASVSKQPVEKSVDEAVEDDLDVILEMQRQAMASMAVSEAPPESTPEEEPMLTVVVDGVDEEETGVAISAQGDAVTVSSAGDNLYGKRGLCERGMVDTGASTSVAARKALFEDIQKKNAPEDWKTRIDELAAQNRALHALKQKMQQQNAELQQELEQEMQLSSQKNQRLQAVEFTADRRDDEIYKLKQTVLVKEQDLSDKLMECRLNEMIRKYLQAQLLSLKKNIRVYCRVRPFLDGESGAVVQPGDSSTSVRQYGDFVSFPESQHPGLAGKGAGLATQLHEFTAEQNMRLKACEVQLNTDSFGRDVVMQEVGHRDVPPYLKNNALRDKLVLSTTERSVTGVSSRKNTPFRFDRVFNPYDSNEDVYADIDELVQSSVDGHAHVSVFMYGQTGSGKTHTMEGSRVKKNDETGKFDFNPHTGIQYRSIATLFRKIQQTTAETNQTLQYTVRMHAIEIYNEELFDLLSDVPVKQIVPVGTSDAPSNRYSGIASTNSSKVEVKQGKVGDYAVYPNEADANQLDFRLNCAPVSISSPEEAYSLLYAGTKNRRVRSTQNNARSSRSHLIVRLYVDSRDSNNGNIFKTSVNLIDQAGSERINNSGVSGDGATEAIEINKGQTALGDVLSALQNSGKHIPYRNNQLTFLLQACLEARNAKVVFLLHASPSAQHTSETINTMRFGAKINTCTVPN